MHPRGFQLLSRARGPQSTRARGGDREVMTCHALVQSWFSVWYQILNFHSCARTRFRLTFFVNKIFTHSMFMVGGMSDYQTPLKDSVENF